MYYGLPSSDFKTFLRLCLFFFRWQQKMIDLVPIGCVVCMLSRTRFLLQYSFEADRAKKKKKRNLFPISFISVNQDRKSFEKGPLAVSVSKLHIWVKPFSLVWLFVIILFVKNNLIDYKFRIRSFGIGYWIRWAKWKIYKYFEGVFFG